MAAADHLADLVQALLDEERARGEVRDALHRQAVALRELRRLGLPSSVVAHRVATARGHVLAVRDRLRLAERLRKRAWRRTRCPGEVARSHRQRDSWAAPSDRATTPAHQESNMPRIVKRTVTTEEFIDQSKPDDETEAEDEVEEQDEIEEEPDAEPARPKRGRRR